MKQTAVEWVLDCLIEQHPNGSFVWNTRADLEALFKQAKEMEKQQQGYSEEQLRKALLDIELVNPAHLTMLRSGYGEFPDSYELTEKGVDYIVEQLKKI